MRVKNVGKEAEEAVHQTQAHHKQSRENRKVPNNSKGDTSSLHLETDYRKYQRVKSD